MTAPVKDQILDAIVTALGGISGIAGFGGDHVERDRDDARPVEETEMPRLLVYDGGNRFDPLYTSQDDYTLRVEIHGGVLSSSGLAAARTLGATFAARVTAALLADVTLGGKCFDIRPSEEPPPKRHALAVADAGYGFELAFEVDYATKEGDPENFPS